MRFALLALIPAVFAAATDVSRAMTDAEVERLVAREVGPLAPANGTGGVAVAVRIEGRTLFFNYGFADLVDKRPITSDSLFNLGSVRKALEVALLAQAVKQGELALDDPVAKYVVELQQGGYIRRVTLGQLATHTSGLLFPTDHPPWPEHGYTLAQFIRALNSWKPERGQEPGKQHIYTHAGFVLLALALERRFSTPIAALIDRRVLAPLGMTSTFMPDREPNGRGGLSPALVRRAVQGYSERGDPIGAPGDQQGYFDFPGMSQMFSSARELAVFVTAHLGELPVEPVMREAMQLSLQGVFRIDPHRTQALAWEINDFGGPRSVDKPGGLNNSSTYIGMVPERKLGIVILANRGGHKLYEMGRQSLLPALAR
jgi:beta-lactamase class C